MLRWTNCRAQHISGADYLLTADVDKALTSTFPLSSPSDTFSKPSGSRYPAALFRSDTPSLIYSLDLWGRRPQGVCLDIRRILRSRSLTGGRDLTHRQNPSATSGSNRLQNKCLTSDRDILQCVSSPLRPVIDTIRVLPKARSSVPLSIGFGRFTIHKPQLNWSDRVTSGQPIDLSSLPHLSHLFHVARSQRIIIKPVCFVHIIYQVQKERHVLLQV